jgi:hypothetical protein
VCRNISSYREIALKRQAPVCIVIAQDGLIPVMNMTSKMMDSMMTMPGMDMMAMNELVEACAACEQACTLCADGSMMSSDMAKCMAMCMDCADMCNTMMRAMLRPSGYDMTAMMAMMQACMAMCMACADECKMHAEMSDQCAMCAEACMQCAAACKKMMDSMQSMMNA